jgi:hypothetical protein
VLAVSFLLGISADPNIKDRWAGTAMDDAVRGGTLYHKYCAKVSFSLCLNVHGYIFFMLETPTGF